MTPAPAEDPDAPLLSVPWKGDSSISLEERTRQAIAARELEGDAKRARVVAPLGLLVWASFVPFDYLQANYLGHGHLRELLTLRLAMCVYLACVTVFVELTITGRTVVGHTFRLTRTTLEAPFVSVLAGMTTCMALGCLVTGGFESLYGAGILMSTASVVLFPRPFRTMLSRLGVILLPYPIVVFGSTLFLPEMRAALGERQPMAFTLGIHFVGVVSAVFLSVVSHNLWATRRELYISQTVGRYRLKKKLGSGGMGEVWSAYHHGLRRDVAVKILRTDAEDDANGPKRFEREIRAMAGLTHPNTVRLYDFGIAEDGRLYYAMELLEGRTLRALVNAEGRLAPARAVHLVTQAARALGEAHARGIVHRDVKPENLFVTRVGNETDLLKVLDFGIASVNGETQLALTKTGTIAGTPGTMSPEVIHGDDASAASDVYALGAVLYFTLTGELPFGDDPAAALIGHVQEPPVPPSARCPAGGTIPADLETIVLRCLEKEPARRFADADALARALEACSLAGRFRPDAAPPPVPELDEPPSGERIKHDAATRAHVRPQRDDTL